MKTLQNHIILYDDECPLCTAYTSAFVKTGMLDQQGRQPYSAFLKQRPTCIDMDRARNEIALVNTQDSTVSYGIESLLKILGHNLPWIKTLSQFKPLEFLLTRLYFFISFNRKVIAPGSTFEGQNQCTPDFSLTYRWAYIVFAWLITSLILVRYSALVVSVIPQGGYLREFMVCGGQVFFQGAIVALIKKDRIIHYLGNMMTISLVGAIGLLPALILSQFYQSSTFFIGYFMGVVALMFIEHVRRTRILELNRIVSMTWILYRFLILSMILLK